MLGVHAHQVVFAHQVHQNHGSQLAIGLLVNRLQAFQGTINHPNSLAGLQKFLWRTLRHVAQGLDQIVRHGGGAVAKTHQTAHAQGGANGRPVGVFHVQTNEQIPAEHRLGNISQLSPPHLLQNIGSTTSASLPRRNFSMVIKGNQAS